MDFSGNSNGVYGYTLIVQKFEGSVNQDAVDEVGIEARLSHETSRLYTPRCPEGRSLPSLEYQPCRLPNAHSNIPKTRQPEGQTDFNAQLHNRIESQYTTMYSVLEPSIA